MMITPIRLLENVSDSTPGPQIPVNSWAGVLQMTARFSSNFDAGSTGFSIVVQWSESEDGPWESLFNIPVDAQGIGPSLAGQQVSRTNEARSFVGWVRGVVGGVPDAGDISLSLYLDG